MVRNHAFVLLLLFLSLALQVAAQAPRPEGQGSEALEPIDPPPATDAPTTTIPTTTTTVTTMPGATPTTAPPTTTPPTTQTFTLPKEPKPPTCSSVKCRTFDGSCTNPSNPEWGQARRTQFSYLKGHSSTFPTGGTLKSAREISNLVSDQGSNTKNSHGLNELFVFFGQFIDHNLVATPLSEDDFNIPVPPGDKFFNKPFLPFKRSIRGLTREGINERPINTLPSALDLVAVYGPVEKRTNFLRKGAKLRTSKGNLLPFNTKNFVNAPDTTRKFFLAGDHRANEHLVLLAMHTMFLREHNRLVDLIKSRMPSLSTKLQFDYARKLNIAKFQKIVYEEFYPAITGKKLSSYSGFKSNVNPTVSDIFAGAAFRFGHTLVGNDIKRKESLGGFLSPIPAKDMFFKSISGTALSTELDRVLAGAIFTSAQELDLKVVDALRNMLFENVKGEEGFDLVAMNIQRGRDHALPTFNEIRKRFGIPAAGSFGDITSDPNLAKAYDSPDEVEAWPGMVAEKKLAGSGMGRTMEAVWKNEFERLRDGDQFFYLRDAGFPAQLLSNFEDVLDDIRDVRKSCLRDLLLRNTGLDPEDIPAGRLLFRPGFF